ncbi:hypothetical protein WICPIJ_008425 [Wickerhamomyces pijperi]|uniref:Glycoside hydrolase family 5 domain-containing protein n=1 Tax=Wickerhamomyces pijperi TaxID=599730 RepID=A0A9P8TIH2_WICPI|nr:hypothetical protein WICPIJ_008425 [Wickerhamomyces pijperi]
MTSIKGPISFDQHGNFLDSSGRVVQLKGINVDGGCKFPQTPYLPSYVPLGKGEEEEEEGDSIFFDGDNVSFVGRPWPLKDVEYHINRLKSMGFNTIRYIITWEALEHAGPGVYDMEFIEYTIEVLKIIHNIGGVFIYLDPHQDVWSRFSGGDGAPMWTLYAAGFDP